jgi:hypothetical protein
VSQEQEEQVCDALVNLGALETEQGLHAEGVRAIQNVLQCSLDDARVALRELRVHKRIEEATASFDHAGDLDAAPRFRWVRPDTQE